MSALPGCIRSADHPGPSKHADTVTQAAPVGARSQLAVGPAPLTDDPLEVLGFAANACAAGAAVALVTLTDIRGGAARRIGSQMAVRDDGLYCGFVSGGCTEAAIAAVALEALASGADREVRFGAGSPYFDIVLPCGGGITLLIHVLRSPHVMLAVLAAVAERRPSGLRYDVSEQSLIDVPHAIETGWNGQRFDIGFRPRARLLIHGRSIELEATAKVARAAGFEVHSCETYESHSASGFIDAFTAVALLFHDIDRELAVLQAALAATPFYIGALGSSRTHQRRIEMLQEMGYSEAAIARIKAPIGIFPKARDARSLALSIVADIAATLG